MTLRAPYPGLLVYFYLDTENNLVVKYGREEMKPFDQTELKTRLLEHYLKADRFVEAAEKDLAMRKAREQKLREERAPKNQLPDDLI